MSGDILITQDARLAMKAALCIQHVNTMHALAALAYVVVGHSSGMQC